MRRPLRLAAVLLAAVGPAGQTATAADVLASAPIDPTMFRDGEVRRSADPYGAWTLVCDAIPRLGHRFCSLSGAPTPVGAAPDGAATLALTVSTGDDGRPAALLHLPLGLSLPFGVRIKPLAPSGGESERRVAIALCSATGCEAVWSLSPGDLAALRAGPGLRITVRGWRFGFPRRHDGAPAPVAATIDGRGFADAVAASLR